MAGTKDISLRQGDLTVDVLQGSTVREDYDATITIKVSGRTVVLKAYTEVERGSDGKLYVVAKLQERHVRSKAKQKMLQDGLSAHKSIQDIVGDPRIGVTLSKDGVRVIDLTQQKD